VTLADDSILRLRFRTAKPSGIQVFFSTRRPSGAFGGNFEVSISAKAGVREPGGWRRVDVPLAKCRSIQPDLAASPAGLQAFFVFVNSYTVDVGLEVAELTITRPAASDQGGSGQPTPQQAQPRHRGEAWQHRGLDDR
jgi:hypothetical protein